MKSKFRENLIKTEQSFIKDLNSNFKKLSEKIVIILQEFMEERVVF